MRFREIVCVFAIVAPLGAFQAQGVPPFEDLVSSLSGMHIAFENQAYLGIGVAEIDSNRARDLKLKAEYGVEVTRVEEDSAAAKAGLKTKDVVLEYNGERVEGIQQFIRLVHETPPGRQVKLLISRNGATQTIPVVMGSDRGRLLRPGAVFQMPRIEIPYDIPRVFTAWSNGALGIEAEALGPQLAAYFGVNQGVLVRSVVKGSAAEKAGIKAGDVITKIDQVTVANPADVSGAVRTIQSRKSFPITLMRDRHETTVTVSVSDNHPENVWPAPSGFPTPALHVRTVKM